MSCISIGGDQEQRSCDGTSPLILSETQGGLVRYSYRVFWNVRIFSLRFLSGFPPYVFEKESETPWATRWDNYLHIFDPRIHWFNLINSLVIVTFLCVMVAMILWRSVSRDVSRVHIYFVFGDTQTFLDFPLQRH